LNMNRGRRYHVSPAAPPDGSNVAATGLRSALHDGLHACRGFAAEFR